MVFQQVQIEAFPRLERFDVEFDLPDCFLPEFPPPIFLTTHPELGDVCQGEVVSIENFDRLFRGLVTPVRLDGLRLLVTQFPQEEFNATHDRKTDKPSLGIACLDCHVSFHTTGQFHLNPDTRPQKDRSGSTRSACAGCSPSRSTDQNGACGRWMILRNLSNGPLISTEIKSGRSKRG